ncbi:MAG: serine hydrolase [Bacteroidales bacterium]|jgi:beta-glucosidase-like glycosyl hydrolase/CubicO group peptidase (beta-lactamase class C family)|nr:serine hydrolase [Bacteroidales bacterium]
MQLKKLIISILIIIPVLIDAQKADPPFLKYSDHPWVDSVLKSLSPGERVAQLVWVAGFATGDISHEVWLNKQITGNGIGGVIFFEGEAGRQSEMINYYNRISKVPLIFAIDAEYGLGMRLENIERFPYQLTLGAIRNDSLIYRMGKAVAGQFKRAGININLAPVADINSNPQNPVINTRSFGEDRDNVRRKTVMYMNGLQDNGIFAVAKHFPGHGDTEVDSHFDLPVLRHSRARLDSVELVPFSALIDSGVAGVMPGHLNVLSVDSTINFPATLSQKVLTQLLRNELNFKGLILSDAMNMGGVTKYSVAGEADALALKAGMDVLEYVTDPDLSIRTIMDKIKNGEIAQQVIDEKCRKVLAAKYWAGLNEPGTINASGIEKDLAKPETEVLIRELYANALTLLKNENNLLPLRNIDKIRIATVAINRKGTTIFQNRISSYKPADHFFIDPSKPNAVSELIQKLSGYDVVIAGVYGIEQRPARESAITSALTSTIDQLTSNSRCVVVWFGNPYSAGRIESLQNAHAMLMAFQENNNTEDLSAQLIFGGIGARGSLPVTINEQWPYGCGLMTPGSIRVQYGLPESAGVSSEMLERKIDSVANRGLEAKAFPGCEVMIARKGIIIFHKTYGYQTYDNRTLLDKNDLFDLASVTKISSTLAGLLVLDSKGIFSTDVTLGEYLPFFSKSNKGDLKMIEILTHQSGLISWLPFWKETLKKNGELNNRIYHREISEKYPLEVANGLYIKEKYRNRIYTDIKKSPLVEKKYVYSDLGMMIAPDIIAKLTGEKWYKFVTDSIYHKIGAYDIGFNPWQRYPLSRIVPTEYDSLFRKQQLHGTVHDEGAAMLGGISGHAGLFATAGDLMKLMELYRRMGSYGGEQIISKDVMERYTRVQFPENNNRRGIGFDKPLLNNSELPQKDAYPAKGVSPSSFGHSGYTGTFVWVDPEYEISYVFFSNRVYPTRNNNLLSSMNIRLDIQQAIYDSIIE